ncbi:hypothetical protein UP17_03445 [Peribacillus simplex]|nr:hypothetical protein UP17_03445 [Peribacillus simplex]
MLFPDLIDCYQVIVEACSFFPYVIIGIPYIRLTLLFFYKEKKYNIYMMVHQFPKKWTAWKSPETSKND